MANGEWLLDLLLVQAIGLSHAWNSFIFKRKLWRRLLVAVVLIGFESFSIEEDLVWEIMFELVIIHPDKNVVVSSFRLQG
jgi:hypothetical protein